MNATKKDLEHPVVTQINRTGYPNLVNQPEHAGIDVMGNEILVGDSIVVMPNGEIVLKDSLEDYLVEFLGFEFKTAE